MYDGEKSALRRSTSRADFHYKHAQILSLSSVFIHHMKPCVILGLPAYPISKGLPPDFRRDHFPQLHL